MQQAKTPKHRKSTIPFDIDDIILNFDPAHPHPRFAAMGLHPDALNPAAALPVAPPWPQAGAPAASPLNPAPQPTDDLTRFAGYDAVIVTWTAAEASALAALMSPGFATTQWYEYRHNVQNYLKLVTGAKAPFNNSSADNGRYYQSLGLYFPCTIGSARILLFKSGLHLDYDGPATPVARLMAEIVTAIGPKIFITTGTGGGIGKTVKLGDVVIAGTVRFDCQTQFKAEPWANASYTPSSLPANALAELTPALTSVNAKRIAGARTQPKYFSAATDAIVTTDFFAFDDSSNTYKLQGLGRACDMGDAMVAKTLQAFPNQTWYAIRNASDPQIPDPTGNAETAAKTAAQIYARYGGLTTAASVLACWAIILAS